MIEIKAVDHIQSIKEIYDLHNIVFNNKISNDLWQWKHFQNPYVQTPKAIIALDKDKIIGATLFMPLMLQLGDKIIKIVQACDGMVHPDYRRMNIFFKIIEYGEHYYANQGCQLIYAFANLHSLAGVMKVGWAKVAQIEQLIFINNPAIISRKINNPMLIKLIQLGWDFFQRQHMDRYDDEVSSFSLKTYSNFHIDMKNINQLYSKQAAELVRSEDFMKWRFDQHPVYKYHYLVAYDEQNELAGYMVTNIIKQDGGITCGKIVDCLVKGNQTECFLYLVQQALTEFKKNNCDLVFAWVFKESLRSRILSDYNFKSLLKFPYQKLMPDHKYFTIKALNPGVLSLTESTQWNLNMVYTDTN